MGKNRRRRRFYPEFYTDEELRQMEETEAMQYQGVQGEQEEWEEYEYEEDGEEGEAEWEEERPRWERIVEPVEPEEPKEPEEIPEDIPAEPEFMPEPEPPLENKMTKITEMTEMAEMPEEPGEININIEIPNDMHIQALPVFAPMPMMQEMPEEPEIFEPEPVFEPAPVPIHKPEPAPAPVPAPKSENIPQTPGMIMLDREKAIEYARRWALDRNPDYYNFEEIGGDCTNYISQILHAGGCKMDKSSQIYGWYYNNANDKSHSWTGVEQLHDYLVREKPHGIIAKEIDANEAEAGDIVQLSFNGKNFQHTPFIVAVKRNASGGLSYDQIKICAHSFDSLDRALDTYQWRKIRFIRILGYKEP